MEQQLTLDQSWTLCLEQWDHVITELDGGSVLTIRGLKKQFLQNKGMLDDPPQTNCFFCEYDDQNPTSVHIICGNCPGRLVDAEFGCCDSRTTPARAHSPYHHSKNPREFHKRIHELNDIRQKSK